MVKLSGMWGGVYDASSQRRQKISLSHATVSKANITVVETAKEQPKRKSNKISYHLLRELEQLPLQLEALEAEIAILQSQVSAPEFFNQPHSVTESVLKALAEKEAEMEMTFERWQELESLKDSQ